MKILWTSKETCYTGANMFDDTRCLMSSLLHAPSGKVCGHNRVRLISDAEQHQVHNKEDHAHLPKFSNSIMGMYSRRTKIAVFARKSIDAIEMDLL